MIGVTLLANFAEASNPVWAFMPGEQHDSAVALKLPSG
jgi:hypothetical protein